jgi:hypothetical protein
LAKLDIIKEINGLHHLPSPEINAEGEYRGVWEMQAGQEMCRLWTLHPAVSIPQPETLDTQEEIQT